MNTYKNYNNKIINKLPSKDMAKLSFSAIIALRAWVSFNFSDLND